MLGEGIYGRSLMGGEGGLGGGEIVRLIWQFNYSKKIF